VEITERHAGVLEVHPAFACAADQRWFCVDRANVRSTPTSLKDRSVDQDADALLSYLEQLDIDQ
jgi:hypothetical protein